MTWTLIFILSYSDPNATRVGDAYNEYATATSPKYWSEAECRAAADVKLANLNWPGGDEGQLRWVCTEDQLITY